MLIFWEKRLVFLATPKAGSTAIEAALEPVSCASFLRPPALKHTTAAHYHKYVAPWIETLAGARFTTVALMREPLEWLQSWYRFYLRDNDFENHDQDQPNLSFEQFVQDYCDQKSGEIGSQSAFLTHDGTKAVDHIFRYDRIDELVRFMEDRLDFAISLPRINVPPPADTALHQDTLARLRSILAKDYALYDTL